MENEPICLNGPHCRQPFCPEHAPVLVPAEVPLEELKKQYPESPLTPRGLSKLDQIELSLFRLSQWLRESYSASLIEIGYKLDKSLRGE